MTKYDYRFDVNLFKSFIGKTFNKYKHHCFSYTNTVALYLGMMIDGEAYVFENDFEALDFFGWDGEATVSKFRKKEWDSILSSHPEDIVATEVNETIKSITIVNDHFTSYAYGKQNYDYWETRSVIFNFGDHELSFTKSDCWFSMEIEINKGYDLIDKVPDGKFILDDFTQSDKQKIETGREVIVLK